jgi:hypothetical protein
MPTAPVVPGLDWKVATLARPPSLLNWRDAVFQGSVEKARIVDTASKRLPGCMQLQLERPSNEVRHVDPGYLTPASGYLEIVLGRLTRAR